MEPEARYLSSPAEPYYVYNGPLDAGVQDMYTDPGPGLGPWGTEAPEEERQEAEEDEEGYAGYASHVSPEDNYDNYTDTETSATAPSEYSQPSKDYGPRWHWSETDQHYTIERQNGVKEFYSEYQKQMDAPERAGRSAPPPRISKPPSWKEPLDSAFQKVAKPKRFYCVGRIFKVVWFEPSGIDVPKAPASGGESWADNCPPLYGEMPVGRFRWFIVVRRRQNYSLCFSITTFQGYGTAKAGSGRPSDCVVLYRHNVEPPKPYDEERITKAPIAVIIEDEEQYIAPTARLDCGRIYTVPDNLKVLSIGRLHPASLPLLNEYYRKSVE